MQAAHALFKAITKKAAPHRRLSDPALWSTSAQTIRYSFDWTGFDRADLASIERASGLAQQCLTDFLKIEPRPYAMEVFYRPHPTHEHQVRFTATAYWRQP
ncbi:MAG: hypothetical protein IT443_11985 [Phycisphaeraceae bacterium]|nr:hypothetical protein [Phycisphaeraceae bacterium]